MSEISILFFGLHLITWIMLFIVLGEIHSMKKEIRQHIDYDSSLRALRKAERKK